jgi:phosphopentomutase
MEKTMEAMRAQPGGLIFVNLVDFDQQYGHRNDVNGYARALEAADRWIPNLDLKPNDVLIITADHGCDPTMPSTDHSREYTPLLVYGHEVAPDRNLGTRQSLADIGQTVAENFGTTIPAGESFLQELQKG